ncbi:low-specificity L-threonine aldolase [soil metagenome]
MSERSDIDLRSDTVTRPTESMRLAMAHAEVGDDVYGDDPTVNRLQQTLAAMFGYEAGLFCASGTQSNLCALLAHCGRGDEYIVGQHAHTYRYEQGGAAVLGSIQPQPLEQGSDGVIALDAIADAIKPDDIHFARTRLLALENTFSGHVLPSDYLRQATTLAHARGLQTHLDGARLFNAIVATGVTPREIVAGFDSVSICLSKGLGAPVGSVLLGTHALVKQANRWRKAVGGGMRQAGVLAAAGLHALEHHVARLADDHRRSRRLADGLRALGLAIETPQTNMVFVPVAADQAAALAAVLERAGIRGWAEAPSMRIVTHLDISDSDIDRVVAAFREWAA